MSDIEAKFFVRSFIRFLNSQREQPNFSSDSRESLEVAIQCLENVYEIAPEEQQSVSDAEDQDNPLNHIDLFEVYRSTFTNVTPERKQEAENMKNEGNRFMKEEKFQAALDMYSKAISLDATNPVFYCNRAAAHNRLGDYQQAADDCRMSLRYDPNYSKAFGRLGLAYTKMNKHELALDAYQSALRIDPNNEDYKNNMNVTQQRLQEQRAASAAVGARPDGPALGSLSGMDFAAAFNNPVLVNMATRMMHDPAVQNMLGQLGGMNNLDALMETGRQLAMQMSSQNPEAFTNVLRQMEQAGVLQGQNAPQNPDQNGPNNGGNGNGGGGNDQQQPPSAN